MDFSKFDTNAVDTKAIEEAKNNQQSFDTPAGEYMAKIEKMEINATKDGRPMFKVMLRVTGATDNSSESVTKYLSHFKKGKMPCLFMNRVLAGTKNDANMIGSVLGWLEKLEPENKPEFKNYNQFVENVLDIYEELADTVELSVNYDADAFNSISILEVYDA